jgi:hypothetical protein
MLIAGSIRCPRRHGRSCGVRYALRWNHQRLFRALTPPRRGRRRPGRPETRISAVAIDASAPQTIYAISSSECYACPSTLSKSVDGGRGWIPLQVTSPADPIQTIAVASDGTVYAGTLYGAVFRSSDGGATWRATNRGLTATSVRSLAVAPGTPSTVYAGIHGGIFARTAGDGWRDASIGLDRNVQLVALRLLLRDLALNNGSVSDTDAAATCDNGAVPDPNVVAIDPTTIWTVYVGAAADVQAPTAALTGLRSTTVSIRSGISVARPSVERSRSTRPLPRRSMRDISVRIPRVPASPCSAMSSGRLTAETLGWRQRAACRHTGKWWSPTP